MTILIIFSALINQPVNAQFYNGHQMNFGKNRVQYNNFYWSYFRFDKYDTYFNQEGEDIARYTGEIANNEILALEKRLNHKLNKRLIFIVYNKYSNFRQSNIGLVTGKEEYNTGGVTKIRNNKVSLYFQGDHIKYNKQLRASISEVLLLEMLYGNQLSDNFANSTMLNLPEWYLNGLTSYLSEEWNTEIENRIKDGIINKRFNKFNGLSGDEAIYAGHSFWKYINDFYGSTVITDIIYLTRINKSANSAILKVLGLPFKEITKQWIEYYNDYFNNQNFNTEIVNTKKNIKTSKNNQVITQVKLSPDGNKLAYVTNELGKYKIWIFNEQTNEHNKIYKHGYKIKQITDYTYPVLTWHPSGKFLTIITEQKGGLKLIQYNLSNENFTSRNLLYYDKILDFDYSDDGSKMVFSAVKDGKTNIYIFDMASSASNQITNDRADDFNPRFIQNSSKIIFCSNRLTSSLLNHNKNAFLDLFIYDLSNKKLLNLTQSDYTKERSPIEVKPDNYFYLSNQNGIYNLFQGKFDSTISHIDTAIHYRYILDKKALTNYNSNILNHDLSTNKTDFSFLYYKKGKYHIHKTTLNDSAISAKKQLKHTIYSKSLKNMADSIHNKLYDKRKPLDTLSILSLENNYVDINNYVFEMEKPYYSYKYKGKKRDTLKLKREHPKIRIYERTFYTDHILSQIDFSFLNNTYQAFTGGAVYFNPGFNALLKIGAYDLLEDYKIIAGVRFSADFNSNEYLVSVENLKPKIDEQIVFHRQTFENITEFFVSNTQTHKLMYIRTIPFSQVNAIKGTLTLRHDKQIYLATDRNTLQTPDVHKLWGGLKFDYIFDNTISTGVNLYHGTRYKIFGEYYNQINKSQTDLFIVGTDFRHYQKIHRDLIFAARFAASTSFGNNKLIYYLGGVDNWTNFSQNTPTFIPLSEIPINEDKDYAYQAVATNLRGFPQNIRNGNSFALINTELRWPFIKYFSNYPINSSFWSNLQLVGFFDAGTAWSGLTPYAAENAYDKQITQRGPITITIDTERDPIVAGYGFGVRAMLFGYFTRFDWAWGIENQQITPGIFYFSLSLDF